MIQSTTTLVINLSIVLEKEETPRLMNGSRRGAQFTIVEIYHPWNLPIQPPVLKLYQQSIVKGQIAFARTLQKL